MWDEVTNFLHKEKYIPKSIIKEQYIWKILDDLRVREWPLNPTGNMAMFYLFGKIKEPVPARVALETNFRRP